jgi:hypothetical protein
MKMHLLFKHHAIKTYWGVEVELHAFLTSTLDESEWLASPPGRFIPREGVSGTHWLLTSFITCTVCHILNDEIHEGKVGSAYGTYEEHNFNWKT